MKVLRTALLFAFALASQASTPVIVPADPAAWRAHDAGRFRILVPSASTNGSYSLIELFEQPGYMTPPHAHPDMDESFYVLEGMLELRLAGKTHKLAAGSYVHIPRNTPHAQGSADGNPVRLLMTLSPGEFEGFFVDRADLVARMPREHADFRRHYLDIVRKHSRWLQPATLEPAAQK
jgi:quercetin dioxygenase-like cupin family protein